MGGSSDPSSSHAGAITAVVTATLCDAFAFALIDEQANTSITSGLV